MKLEFSGKHALILGGSCELGITLAGLMIKAGLFPVLTFRNEAGRKKIVTAMEPGDGSYSTAFFDLADPDSVDSLFQSGDSVEYLVDFAQGDLERLVASHGSTDKGKYFEENVANRTKVIAHVARIMLGNQFGRLVFVSSTAAVRPNHGQGFYAAAKLASEAIYKNLGLELGGRGVTTVILRPGYIDTGRAKKFIQSKEKEICERVPIKRLLVSGEVAETILFFLSKSAEGFNATEITLDGGLTAGK